VGRLIERSKRSDLLRKLPILSGRSGNKVSREPVNGTLIATCLLEKTRESLAWCKKRRAPQSCDTGGDLNLPCKQGKRAQKEKSLLQGGKGTIYQERRNQKFGCF